MIVLTPIILHIQLTQEPRKIKVTFIYLLVNLSTFSIKGILHLFIIFFRISDIDKECFGGDRSWLRLAKTENRKFCSNTVNLCRNGMLVLSLDLVLSYWHLYELA